MEIIEGVVARCCCKTSKADQNMYRLTYEIVSDVENVLLRVN